LPSKELHTRLPGLTKPGEAVIIDAPQMEDHAGIARSAMRYADEIVIPVAPAGIELARMGPVRGEIEDMQAARRVPSRVSVMLNRVVAAAASGPETREDLTDAGWHVLGAAIPRREMFAQSYGGPVRATATPYQLVAEELLKRGAA
jgi:chromosome partitioning protein